MELRLNGAGQLLAVSLPKNPPRDLSQKDLQAAFDALAKFEPAPANSQALQRFRDALQLVPVGHTRTYGEIAHTLSTSPRAVGQWCASNPLLLKIPCHRIVSKSGAGGFSQGFHWKHLLLQLESSYVPPAPVNQADKR